MNGSAEGRLAALGLSLPPAPTPFGSYVEAVRVGDMVYFSGMLPAVGHDLPILGRLGAELTVEEGHKAAQMAVLSGLSAARALLGSLDRVTRVAKLGVYIATAGDFREHPRVADGASDVMRAVFGEALLSGRVVLGVASLPLGVPVEVELLLEAAG